MTKEVLVSVSGLQFMGEESESVEIITPGSYYLKNNKHYIIYEEVAEGVTGTVNNTIKVGPEGISLRKTGIVNVNMIFTKDQRSLTCYSTPFGDLMVGITTNDIRMEETDQRMKIEIDYMLEINEQQISDCRIQILVNARGLKSSPVLQEE